MRTRITCAVAAAALAVLLVPDVVARAEASNAVVSPAPYCVDWAELCVYGEPGYGGRRWGYEYGALEAGRCYPAPPFGDQGIRSVASRFDRRFVDIYIDGRCDYRVGTVASGEDLPLTRGHSFSVSPYEDR